MLSYIRFELKRKLYNRKSLFLIFLIFLLLLNMVVRKDKDVKLTDDEARYGEYKELNNMEYLGPLRDYEKWCRLDDIEPDKGYVDTFNLMKIPLDGMKKSLDNENYPEYYKNKAFFTLLVSRRNLPGLHTNLLEEVKEQTIDHWNNISQGIDYDKVKYPPYIISMESSLNKVEQSKYEYEKYLNNSTYRVGGKLDGPMFLYYLFKELFPMMIPFFICLLLFDNINKDIVDDNMKMILPKMKNKRDYIIGKNISGFLYSIIMFIIPVSMIFIYCSIKHGMASINLPIYYYDNILGIKPIPNYTEIQGGYIGIGVTKASVFPMDAGTFNGLFHPDMEFMKMIKMILLGFILILFIVLFYVSIINLISTIVNNRVTSMIIGIIFNIIALLISKGYTMGDRLNINPFSLSNPIRIIDGSYNSTWLLAIIVLSISTIIVFNINIICLKRKDI